MSVNYPKYEVGDKVIIVPKLLDDMPCSIDEDMIPYQDKVVTIKKVFDSTTDDNAGKYGESYQYYIEEDGGFFTWTSPMILSYAGDFERYSAVGIIVTRDGTEFIRSGSTYMSARGIEIPIADYVKNKHNSSESADIVEIYSRKEGSNYLFDKGELVWKEEQE